MRKRHRVAIIGAGIGREHLAGYLCLPDHFEVSTICDFDRERAREIAGPDSTIAITDEFDTVLADPQLDIIDICLPPHLHVSTSIAAMEAGKHVICEKPIASSLAEADRLIAASERTKMTFSPVFQCRFGLAMAQIDALKAADLLGPLYSGSAQIHWNRGADYYAVPWRGTWKGENGGAVLSHAIHAHDLLGVIAGPLTRVQASLATRVNSIETEDCAAIIFETSNGALITSSVTLGGADDVTNFRFCFQNITIQSTSAPYAPCEKSWTFLARDPARQKEIDQVLSQVSLPHVGFAGFFEAFADTLENKPNKSVTLADGRRSLELVSAIYLSDRTGEKIELPLDRTHPVYSSWHPADPEVV